MKLGIALSSALLSVAVLLSLAVGCSTTPQTENLLIAAGFTSMPATTDAQRAHLKTLTPNKVTTVVRDGKTYFVFPDVKQEVLYVGQQPQYEEYQKLRLQKQMADEELQTAEMNSEPAFGVWGAWGGVVPVERRPIYRR
jgi:hypothetical protein